jgi:hypothetical protein
VKGTPTSVLNNKCSHWSSICPLTSGPPRNEVPTVLCEDDPMLWRSADAAMAVASVLVYRRCLELAILGRTRRAGADDASDAGLDMVRRAIGGRAVTGALRLGVQGVVLDAQGIRAEQWVSQEKLRSAAERSTILW